MNVYPLSCGNKNSAHLDLGGERVPALCLKRGGIAATILIVPLIATSLFSAWTIDIAHASNGWWQYGIFHVFSSKDLASELRAIFLYLLIPLGIGAAFIRLLIYVFPRQFRTHLQDISGAPVSIALSAMFFTRLSPPVLFFVILSSRGISASTVLFDGLFVFFLTWPLWLLGTILAAYIVLAKRHKSKGLDLALYASSATCVVAQYLWFGLALSH